MRKRISRAVYPRVRLTATSDFGFSKPAIFHARGLVGNFTGNWCAGVEANPSPARVSAFSVRDTRPIPKPFSAENRYVPKGRIVEYQSCSII